MSTQLTSAVEFATESRVHLGLGVTDMDAATRFYTALFGAPPTKVRDGYARFEPQSPPVNLSLNLGMSRGIFGGHFGVQVKDQAGIEATGQRLEAAGFALRTKEGVTCCWAVSEKIWADDPDGHAWEVFMIVDDHAPVHSAGKNEGCCSPAPPRSKRRSAPAVADPAQTRAAWDALGDEVGHWLAGRAPKDVADDLLQEVSLKVHTRLDQLQSGNSLRPWVFQIARGGRSLSAAS